MSRDEGKMAAMEQERYAFSRGTGGGGCGFATYGGCRAAGFPTAVELQLHSAAGAAGTALTRTRVVPASSPRGGRSSSSPRIVSALLPCVSGGQKKVVDREGGGGKGVVVRNSTYRFSEDDEEEAGPESRRSAHEHRLHTDTEEAGPESRRPAHEHHLHTDTEEAGPVSLRSAHEHRHVDTEEAGPVNRRPAHEHRLHTDTEEAGPGPESRRPAHEHRHADTEAFQSAGTGVRLLGKARTKKRRKRAGRRLSCNKKEVLDSLCDTRSAAASCPAGADPVDSTAPRKWISLTLGRRRRRQQSGRRNTVTEGQDRGRSDLEMSLNDEQPERCWVQDVDLLRNDAVNGGNCATSAAISR